MSSGARAASLGEDIDLRSTPGFKAQSANPCRATCHDVNVPHNPRPRDVPTPASAHTYLLRNSAQAFYFPLILTN